MELRFKNFRLNLTWTWQEPISLPPDKLLFDRVHLDVLLRPYFDNKASLIAILLSQVSVLITIGLTLLVSDIPNKWGIDKNQWFLIVVATSLCLALWSIYVFYRLLKQRSFEDFLNYITSKSLTIQERRFVFLIIGKDSEGYKRVLVQYSDSWKCWLLPNFGRNQSKDANTNEKLENALAQKLATEPAAFSILSINEDLLNYKWSYKNNKFTHYYFDFFQVLINSQLLEKALCDGKSFERAGTKFAWMTPAEMKADVNTRERNSDVINHLEEQIFPNGTPSISFNSIIGNK